MTEALVSIISRVITSQQFFLYNSITFISISIASIPVPATHIPTINISNNQYMIPAIQMLVNIIMIVVGIVFSCIFVGLLILVIRALLKYIRTEK